MEPLDLSDDWSIDADAWPFGEGATFLDDSDGDDGPATSCQNQVEYSSFLRSASTFSKLQRAAVTRQGDSLAGDPPAKRQCNDSSSPSDYLRQALYNKTKTPLQQQGELHRACCRSTVSEAEIKQLLNMYPLAVLESTRVHTFKKIYNPTKQTMQAKMVQESYTYPLLLAIAHQLKPSIIRLLIDAAPCILMVRDGFPLDTPLTALLKHAPEQLSLVQHMLLTKPNCITLADRSASTPLHLACSRGAPLSVVQSLVQTHPAALEAKDSRGQTPWEVARQRTLTCSEEVAKYMRLMMVQWVTRQPLSNNV